MSLFKFHDSNFLEKSNHPDVVATVDTYNGEQFKIVTTAGVDTAVPFATDAEVKLGNAYVMWNIIDKPQIYNTDDYKVAAGGALRTFRIKDFIGEKFDVSADVVSDAFATVAVGDTLVGRCAADTTNTMGLKKVADVTGYAVYYVVTKKSTFGAFTIDKTGGAVAGGYVLKVVAA